MQLIEITSVPIQYKIQIEPSKLVMQQAQNAKMEMSFSPARLNMEQKNTKVRIDTTEMRSSIGLKNVDTKIAEAAQRGMQAAQRATAEIAQQGNQMAQIQDGVTIGQIARQKMLSQPDSITVFLPNVGPSISWEPAELNVQYQPSELNVDWQTMQNTLDYVPGKFQMIIERYPRVQIEYLGEPNYVPPSANPNYEE